MRTPSEIDTFFQSQSQPPKPEPVGRRTLHYGSSTQVPIPISESSHTHRDTKIYRYIQTAKDTIIQIASMLLL